MFAKVGLICHYSWFLFSALLGLHCSTRALPHGVEHGLLCGVQGLSSCRARASLVVAHTLILPRGFWDPSSLTRDQTQVTCIGRQIPNHHTTREALYRQLLFLFFKFLFIYGWARSLLLHRFSLVVASNGYPLVVVHELLIPVASLEEFEGARASIVATWS